MTERGWAPWAAGRAELAWIVLTSDGFESAGTTFAHPSPVDAATVAAMPALDPSSLGDVQWLEPDSTPPVDEFDLVQPIAWLCTTEGLVTWSDRAGAPVGFRSQWLEGLLELRPGAVLGDALSSRIAGALVGAGVARVGTADVAIDSEQGLDGQDTTPDAATAGPLTPDRSLPTRGAARRRLRRMIPWTAHASAESATEEGADDTARRRDGVGTATQTLPSEGPTRPSEGQRLPVWSATCARPWDGNPLALGLVQSSIAVYDGGRLRERVDLVPIRTSADQVIVDVLDAGRPGVLFTSNYFWTLEENLELAARVKAVSPLTLVVFGGPAAPSYPERVVDFLAEHPQVDVLVHGEGEITAAEIVACWVDSCDHDLRRLADVPGLSVRTESGPLRSPDRARLADLDSIPSPYLDGRFDHLPAEIGIWAVETNRGCPYGCTFCDWGAATRSRIRQYDIERVKAELDWIALHGAPAVFITDANFGIFARDVEIAEHVATLRRTLGAPRSMIFTFAKNTVKHTVQIARILQDAGLATEATISFQTTDEETLVNIDRKNIKLSAYAELAIDARDNDVPVLADLMLGLPGMTLETFKTDLQACFEQDISTRAFTTLVLENSPMNEPAYRRRFEIATDEFSQVISSSSFSAEDRDEVVRFRNAFRFADHFGALRQVLRFVAHETGRREVDVFADLYDATRAAPGEHPVLFFAFHHARCYLTTTIGWPPLLAEARHLVVDRYGLDPSEGLDLVLDVQDALLPNPAREYPFTMQLQHDAASYFRQLVDPRRSEVPRLVEFGPASFAVDSAGSVLDGLIQPAMPILNSDGRPVLLDEFGWNEDNNWELDSPLARRIRGSYVG